MATINLGAIKFNWQGAYAGGTAYVVDDVVSYNGSSYVCKLASTGNLPTNATYWDQMSSAGTNGTNGTDLGTTLTTQGDLVYRDGSGLQRLGAGTAGQVLQTGGAGANPSWGTVSSDYVKLAEATASNSASVSVDGYFSATYKHYILIGSNISPSTGAQLRMRVIEGGVVNTGGIYRGIISGSEHYNTGTGIGNQGNSWGYGNTEHNVTGVSLTPDSGTTVWGSIYFIHTWFNPLSTSNYKTYYQQFAYQNSTNMVNGFGSGITESNSAMSGVQFYMNTGNIHQGTFTLYGIKA
jgi:hypothetical protein